MTVTTVMSAAAFMGPVASAQTLPQIPEEELNAYPVYSGNDLELTVDAKGTHFALWSPGAEAVRLHLYADGHNGNAYKTVEMAKDAATGVWRASKSEKLYGKFYTFQVKIGGEWLKETP